MKAVALLLLAPACAALAVGQQGAVSTHPTPPTRPPAGAPGLVQTKVMYSLIEAEAYTGKQILVGGDSAVEAAMGLAHLQPDQGG